MKAGVVFAKNDIRYVDIDRPEISDDEVLIKVAYTGICGSDVPRVNGDACHFFPNVLGHEFSGTVVEVGSNVTHLEVGDRVAGVPLVPCMECDDCLKGNYSLCKHYSFIGSRQFGSFAEYVKVPARNAVKFDDEVTFEQGAFFEPATVALHGLRRLDYKSGKKVAVLGGGTIGMFTAQFAKIFGAQEVVVFDILDERLDLARRLGLEGINTSKEGWKEEAMALTDGKGFDFVYETAGNVATIKLVFELCANKGQACLIGTPTKELVFTEEQWEMINRKEMILTGSWMSYSPAFPGDEWTLVAHYFKTGQLKFDDSFIFRKMPLEHISDAFEMYKTRGLVKGKILIDSRQTA
ncbi:galactitol-1-phosphate 5-dehydrogenase [Erysipelotrichaceae bacterium 51-3]